MAKLESASGVLAPWCGQSSSIAGPEKISRDGAHVTHRAKKMPYFTSASSIASRLGPSIMTARVSPSA